MRPDYRPMVLGEKWESARGFSLEKSLVKFFYIFFGQNTPEAILRLMEFLILIQHACLRVFYCISWPSYPDISPSYRWRPKLC